MSTQLFLYKLMQCENNSILNPHVCLHVTNLVSFVSIHRTIVFIKHTFIVINEIVQSAQFLFTRKIAYNKRFYVKNKCEIKHRSVAKFYRFNPTISNCLWGFCFLCIFLQHIYSIGERVFSSCFSGIMPC